MTTTYKIPLTPKPQSFSVTFPNGVDYQIRLLYQFNDDACWIMDISDAAGTPMVCGIPLVTGADLLAQYAYLGFGAQMFVTTEGDIAEPPHWWNLGGAANLYVSG
jgi:hypothetical protein